MLACLTLPRPATVQPGGMLARERYIPREIVAFPNVPWGGQALAARMRMEGFLILGVAPMSGMVLAAVPMEGMEWAMAEWVRTCGDGAEYPG